MQETAWAWLEVCKMFGTRVSGHHHVEFEVLLSDWRAPTKRNRLSSIELLIKSSFILGWASKLTLEYTTPLRAALFFGAPHGALRERFLLPKAYFGRFFSPIFVPKNFPMPKHRKFPESSTIPIFIFWIALFLIEGSAQPTPNLFLPQVNLYLSIKNNAIQKTTLGHVKLSRNLQCFIASEIFWSRKWDLSRPPNRLF